MIHLQERRGSLLVGLALLLLATACGGSVRSGSQGTGSPAASATSPSPIDGLYFSGHSVLRFQKGQWKLVAQALRMAGTIDVTPGRLTLSNQAFCPNSAGTYSWAESGKKLTITSLSDRCPGRDVIVSGSWEPISPLSAVSKKGDQVALDDLLFATYQGERDVSTKTGTEIHVQVKAGANGYSFSPTVLVGAPRQQLQLTVLNPVGANFESIFHDFSVPAEGISFDLLPGQQRTVTVTFPASGSISFFCRYHAKYGQAGELTVAG